MKNINIKKSVSNIQIIENILSKEEHKKLLDYAENIDSWRVQPWGVKVFEPEDVAKEFSEILDKIFMLAYKSCVNFYGVDLYPFKNGEIPLIKFEKGYKMNEHADTAGDFAVIYYLNDDYDGGEINFMDYNLKIKPKANSFVTFPSNSDYWHEVLENIGKERYSATKWFKFNGSSVSRPELGLTR
jgi:Rps23 Pro-64 3,4-dihydroxylase Tpa1-like proline 4-hydroxylase